MITTRVNTEINNHSTKPCNKGLNPTDKSTCLDKPLPIRNSVKVKPDLEMLAMV